MTGTLLPDWLGCQARNHPDKPALIVAGPSGYCLSFADLEQRATATAYRIAGTGVGRGDRVASLLRNGPHVVEVVHALTRLGAVFVPLNSRLTPAEIAWQVQHCSATLLLHDTDTLHLVEPSILSPRLLVSPRQKGDTQTPYSQTDVALRTHIDFNAVQCIIYTSGTTGRPKGAMLTFGNHWWSAIASSLNLGLHADDRWLVCLPLFHIGGLSILLRSVIYGIPIVFAEEPGAPFDPKSINRAIAAEKVTIVSVVSTMLRRMLEERHEEGNVPAFSSSLRCVLLGGGPAPRPLLEECARRAMPIVQTYGLTEAASQVATLAPADALRKLGAAGQALLPTEVRIEKSEDAPGLAGEMLTGEILVRGPTISPGYVPSPDEDSAPQAAVDAEGWLHTGDLGYLDDEGHLYVLDRRADLIISGGENVYPAEVEAVLLAHPHIAEAGVFPIADSHWGQRVAAAVVAKAGYALDEASILAFCRTYLAAYKLPAQLQVVEALPRNAAGKLLRRELRANHANAAPKSDKMNE